MLTPLRIAGPTSLMLVFSAAQMAIAIEQQSPARQAATSTGWSLITITSAGITLVAIVVLAYTVRRYFLRRASRSKNDPRQLLHELCQAHGLSRRAERLLRKAAAAVGTPHPGRFFLEPSLLRQAEECPELKGSRRILGLLYERLFGDDQP